MAPPVMKLQLISIQVDDEFDIFGRVDSLLLE